MLISGGNHVQNIEDIPENLPTFDIVQMEPLRTTTSYESPLSSVIFRVHMTIVNHEQNTRQERINHTGIDL